MAGTLELLRFTEIQPGTAGYPDGALDFLLRFTGADGSVNETGYVIPGLKSDILRGLAAQNAELESEDVIRRLLFAYWMARSPELTNQQIVVGRRFILDMSNSQAIRVQ